MAKGKRQKQKPAPEVQVEKLSKEFAFPLNDEEQKLMLKNISQLMLERDEREMEFKRQKKHYDNQQEATIKEISRIAVVARDGKENRLVECEMRKDFASKLIQYYFQGKLMEERAMTPEEFQMSLPLKTKSKKKSLRKELTGAEKTYLKAKGTPHATGNGKAGNDVADTIKQETSRRTKRSAVDGVFGTA